MLFYSGSKSIARSNLGSRQNYMLVPSLHCNKVAAIAPVTTPLSSRVNRLAECKDVASVLQLKTPACMCAYARPIPMAHSSLERHNYRLTHGLALPIQEVWLNASQN